MALKKSDRLYLSEELNFVKMYRLHQDEFPNQPILYEFYKTVFNKNSTFRSGILEKIPVVFVISILQQKKI